MFINASTANPNLQVFPTSSNIFGFMDVFILFILRMFIHIISVYHMNAKSFETIALC